MTVLITGASGVIGRAAVKALLARDEVRATVRRPEAADALRALGAKVAVRAGAQADELVEILPRCHTLVHLTGGIEQPDPDALFWANHRSTLIAVQAAKEASTRRIVFVSVPGADPEHAHPFLRAKGMAEEAIVASGLEYAIVRCAHAYGLGGAWFAAFVHGASATPPFVCGPGSQEVAPVYADDVGAVLAAIDDRREPVAGTWGLEGPDALTADALVRVLRDDDEAPAHADGQAAAAALSRLFDAPVDAVTASFYGMPSRADAPDAADAFGVRRTPLLDGLRETLASAAAVDPG
jgi:NADH dehydrogenase